MKKVIRNIIVFVFIVWFLLALFRSAYYVVSFHLLEQSNIYSANKNLVNVLEVSRKIPKTEEVIVYSTNGGTFFTARYLLFPVKVCWSEEKRERCPSATQAIKEGNISDKISPRFHETYKSGNFRLFTI